MTPGIGKGLGKTALARPGMKPRLGPGVAGGARQEAFRLLMRGLLQRGKSKRQSLDPGPDRCTWRARLSSTLLTRLGQTASSAVLARPGAPAHAPLSAFVPGIRCLWHVRKNDVMEC